MSSRRDVSRLQTASPLLCSPSCDVTRQADAARNPSSKPAPTPRSLMTAPNRAWFEAAGRNDAWTPAVRLPLSEMGRDERQLMHSYSVTKGAQSPSERPSSCRARQASLFSLRPCGERSIEAWCADCAPDGRRCTGLPKVRHKKVRRATPQCEILHSITASSSNLRRPTWQKVIGSPRNQKKRRSRQLRQRQAKRPQDGSRPSILTKRNSDAIRTLASDELLS